MNEWVNEWMSEWMNEEKKYVLRQKILIGQNSTKRNE